MQTLAAALEKLSTELLTNNGERLMKDLTYAIFELRKKDELRSFVIARITDNATVVPKHVPNYKGTAAIAQDPGNNRDCLVKMAFDVREKPVIATVPDLPTVVCTESDQTGMLLATSSAKHMLRSIL